LESLNTDQTPNHLRREALYKLGLVHLKMKNTDIAKMAFEKVVEQNINDDYNRKAKTKLSKIK
jgi:outer membrane protein assembly factor BamD (BamD/ComL family)